MAKRFVARFLAVFTVFAVMAGVTPASLPSLRPVTAHATMPDADVAGMLAGITQFTTFSQGLAGDGLLGQNLPDLTVAPGGPSGAGLDTLLAGVFSTARENGINHCSDLSLLGTGGTPLSLSGGRTVAVAIGSGGAPTCGNSSTQDTLPVSITVTKNVDTGLAISQSGGSFSLNSSGGLGLSMTLTLNFQFVYVPSQTYFYVANGVGTAPSLNLALDGTLTNGTISAALGILGVTATTPSLTFHAHLKAGVADPGGTGRLAFSDPASSGPPTPGALATGTAASIFTIGWDHALANTVDGSFNVVATPDASIGLGSLPSVSGTVAVHSADLSTGSPTVTLTGFDPLSLLTRFQNLTPRDLGDGLAHLATALAGIQGAKVGALGNINLPFMQGKLADAIRVSEDLILFLAGPAGNPSLGAVDQATDTPRFASIQELLTRLKNVIGVDGQKDFKNFSVSFDQTTSKMAITFEIKRDPGTAISLDPGPTTAYPTAGITEGALTITDTTFADASAHWSINQWQGFTVSAGGVTATVKTNTDHVLTLNIPTSATSGWSAATPSGASSYRIQTSDPGIGNVSFGNLLGHSGGLLGANASIPVAQVTPSYDATLTLVLDLEPPVTGSACNGFQGSVEACPFTRINIDGSHQVITSLPLAPDRIMLRTGQDIFTADAPISTAVHLGAKAGFLTVNLDGTLCEFTTGGNCTTASTTSHLIKVSLKPVGDAQHDIALGRVFTLLTGNGVDPNPGQLLTIEMHGGGSASLTATVPGVTDFFSSPATASVTVDDVTASLSDTANVHVVAPDFAKLLDFGQVGCVVSATPLTAPDPSCPLPNSSKDSKALFGLIIQALTGLLNQIGNLPDDGGYLSKKIPVINQSIRDIIAGNAGSSGAGVTYTANTMTDPNTAFDAHWLGRTITSGTNTATVIPTISVPVPTGHTVNLTNWTHAPTNGDPWKANSELQAAIDVLTAKPTVDLQGLVNVLNTILPTTVAQAVSFKVDTTEASDPKLDLKVHWDRSFSKSVPVAFDYNFGGDGAGNPGAQSLVGVGATGQFNVTGQVSAVLDVLIALSTDTSKHCAIGSTEGICLDPASGITASVTADGSNLGIQATFGPVSVKVGNPADGAPGVIKAAFDAHLGTTATAASGASGVSLSSYFSNFNVGLNTGTASANCTGTTGFTSPSGIPLSMCAFLPLYVSTDGGVTFTRVTSGGGTILDSFTLRLPKSTSLGDAFDLSGTLPSSTAKRFDYPPELFTDFANAVLDLNDLNNGIDGYFQFAKNALNLASAGGKLPLIGHDLQQGADFIGDLQARFDSVLGPTGLTGVSTVGQLQVKFNTTLATALQGVGDGYLNATVVGTATCNSTGAVKAPAVSGITNSAPAGSVSYKYQVFGVTAGAPGTIVGPGTEATLATSVSPLSAPHPNHITWTPNAQFAKYTVVRTQDSSSILSNGVIANDVTGGTLDDTGLPRLSGPPTAGAVAPCDTITSLSSGNLTGFTLALHIGKGTVGPVATPGCADGPGASTHPEQRCLAPVDVPLNIGVPGLAIKATGDSNDRLKVAIGYSFDVTFGIDKQHGFFINAAGGDGTTVLGLGVSLNMPAAMKAQIAFLQVCLTNHQASPDYNANPDYPCNPSGAVDTPLIGASFLINLKEGAPGSGIVTLSQLQAQPLSDFFKPFLSAKLNIDWDFQVDVSASQELPGIGGEFKFIWGWSNADPGADMASSEAGNKLEFDNIYISAGKFLTGVLGKALSEVQTIISPLKPIIDIITAPIPLLSDLSHIAGGPDITLITLAKAFSTVLGGPDLSFIDTIVKVVQTISSIAAAANNSVHIAIGSFSLLGANHAVFHSAYTPDTPNPQTHDPEINAADPPSAIGAADGATGNALSNTANGSFGFTFPLFSHPASIFNLLMGKDVTLVQFDSGPLTLGFQYSQAFGPVYAPPPVLVVIAGGASITAHIVLGFDTFGIRTGVQNGFTLHGFLDSLFIKTTDDSGHAIPAISLSGFLAAGAEVSILIISVGIEGGIRLTINFLWHDPDNDGKLRFSEFVDSISKGPLCLFDFSGSLNFFLKVFITIGFSIFSYTFDFTIIDIVLLDFSDNHTCDAPPTPPVLGAIAGNTLYVFAGKLGNYRGSGWGNSSGADESVKVQQLYDNSNVFAGISLTLIGHTQTFNATAAAAVDRVLVDARGYAGKENILMTPARQQTTNNASANSGPTPPFTYKAIVFGGNNDDTIKVGDGQAFIDGGPGDDVIQAGEGVNNMIAGGSGKDQIKTGNGGSWVAGDGALHVTGLGGDVAATDADGHAVTIHQADTFNPNGAITHDAVPAEVPGDGGDHINVGRGPNTVYGGGGDDQISVAPDSPLAAFPPGSPKRVSCEPHCVDAPNFIVGGKGNNTIVGGTNDDTIFAGQWADPGSDRTVWTGVAGDGMNHVDTGGGNDIVFGGSNRDVITGHSLAIPGHDCAGNPTATQSDCIYAGDGDDVVQGGNGNDWIYGGNGNDILRGGTGSDHLFGQAGDDILVGVGGNAILDGGAGDDYLFGGDVQYLNNAGSPIDISLFNINDASGFTHDIKYGLTRSNVKPLPAANTSGHNVLIGGADNDHIFASDNGDEIYGDQRTNFCGPQPGQPLFTPPSEAGQNAIAAAGQDGNDTIVGGKGVDHIQGGGGDDLITGGGGNSFLCGGAGNDIIHGGTGNVIAWGGTGDDQIFGDSGNSELFGNDGNDTIIGGLGSVYVEGGNGNDTIYGGQGPSILIGGSSQAGLTDQDTYGGVSRNTMIGGPHNDILIGNNGCAASSFASTAFLIPVNCAGGPSIQVFDQVLGASPSLGGGDYMDGGGGDNRMFGGLGDDIMVAGNGNNYIEGGSGNNTITAGNGDNVIIGGSSHGIDLAPHTAIPNGHTIITAGNGKDVVIAHNGCVNTVLMPASCPSSAAQAPPTAFGRRPVLQLYDSQANSTVYGNGTTILVGGGGDMVFGGLGGNHIVAGDGDNYLQGGPSDSYIEGGHGNNDIVGGNSPIGLVPGTTTYLLPIGANQIYADGGTGSSGDGTNVVIGSNGSITRDEPLQFDSHREAGKAPFIKRHIVRLDVYDLAASPRPLLGQQNWIYGGTNDDILIGGPAGDHIFGGPPNVKGLFIDNTDCDTQSILHCNFDNTAPAGNDYIEGGNGNNYLHAGGGDTDIVGGNSDQYLDPAVDPLLSTSRLSAHPNLIWGGTGNDYMLSANGRVIHKIDSATNQWRVNPNDNSFVRSVYLYDLADGTSPGIGGSSTIWGENGNNHIYGENGVNYLYGGPRFDYIEGGTGANIIQGRGGDNDIVGGNSPESMPPAPAGQNNETIAGNLPSGGNLICGNLCGVDKTLANPGDDVILGHNGRIGRCADSASGAHNDNDICTWTVVRFGNQKNPDGTVSLTPLGDPRQRFVDLVGQDPSERTHNGSVDIEGNGGNNVIYAEDGTSVVHGGTPPGGQTAAQILTNTVPAGGQPRRDECLPHQSALQGHDVIVGGYGAKVLCGGGGDDLIIGSRGDYKVVPFGGAPTTIGRAIGPIFTTVTFPASGKTIYQKVDLTQELGKPVADWKTANGYKIIFGGHGNNTIHAGPGDNFVQGADGMHVTGQPKSTAGDNAIFGGIGNTSIEGGPGNDVIYGGSGNKDIDVVRDDVGVVNKIDDNAAPLPPLYPTINADPATFGITGRQSYASRFPLPGAQTYDSDPGGFSHGGGVFHTTTYGDIIYGGTGRNVMQISDEGSRMIDETGNWDLWLVCHAQYGEPNIDRSHDPALHQFVLDLASAEGVTDPTDPNSSGFAEVSWSAASHGSAYPGTPGHRHCEP